MFAARDQENLIHLQQTIAASKPLNQGTKALQAKTAGNRALQTPLKIPLNDENASRTLKFGKTGGKGGSKENAQAVKEGKKAVQLTSHDLATPAPKPRAALGPKTTNAKTKFQTPVPALGDNGLGKTQKQNSTARKPTVKLQHTPETRLKIPVDISGEEPDVEYAPPPVKDLPDFPDHMFTDADLEIMREAYEPVNIFRAHFNTPGDDGLTILERDARERDEERRIGQLRDEAESLRIIESQLLPCTHHPICRNGKCKDWPEQLSNAEEDYQKTMKDLIFPKDRRRMEAEVAERLAVERERSQAAVHMTTATSRGPSITASRSAAAALSMKPARTVSGRDTVRAPRQRATILPRQDSALPSAMRPTVSSAERHATAVAASRSTIGYGKGRSVSATMKKVQEQGRTHVPTLANAKKADAKKRQGSVEPDHELTKEEATPGRISPMSYYHRFGMPELGSDMWFQFSDLGLDNVDNVDQVLEREGKRIESMPKMEQAEEDFQLDLPA